MGESNQSDNPLRRYMNTKEENPYLLPNPINEMQDQKLQQMLSSSNNHNSSFANDSEDQRVLRRTDKILRNDFYDEVNVDQYHTFEGPGGKASKEEASFAADHQGLVDDAVYVRR